MWLARFTTCGARECPNGHTSNVDDEYHGRRISAIAARIVLTIMTLVAVLPDIVALGSGGTPDQPTVFVHLTSERCR